MKPSTIAIDGPAASGKSTVGQLLARRLGYRRLNGWRSDRQLQGDLMVCSAIVRGFVARHIDRDYLPDPEFATAADLVFRDDVSDDAKAKALSELKVNDIERVCEHLRHLAGGGQLSEHAADCSHQEATASIGPGSSSESRPRSRRLP